MHGDCKGERGDRGGRVCGVFEREQTVPVQVVCVCVFVCVGVLIGKEIGFIRVY